MAFEPGYRVKWEKSWFKPHSTEPYVMSRSKVEFFTECPRCFWLEARFGIGRPGMPSFTLNNAVDELFKREFDVLRAKGEKHPIMEQYGIDAVPFEHEQLEEWRDAMKRGIKYHDPETNITLRGGIDDIWKDNTSGELYIVDYKATAGKDEVTLDDKWKESYKRQIEIYQWLFRMNGFPVSNTGYFVYANGRADKEAFDAKLEFDVTVLPYEGDSSWLPNILKDIKKCLVAETAPKKGVRCEFCPYREHAGLKLQELHKAAKK
jgi:CRISPR/Cas system-associated exonuclease Cas4 (RecB family)